MSAAEKLRHELRIAEVAALLSVTTDRVTRLVMRMGLPCIPESLRFDRDQVLAWFDALPKTTRPPSAPTGAWPVAPEIVPLAAPETGGVYAIGAACGHVKIGKAWNIKRRLANLQTANPAPLVLLAVLSDVQEDEGEFHHALSAHCVGGEWFAPHADVVMAIRDARRIW